MAFLLANEASKREVHLSYSGVGSVDRGHALAGLDPFEDVEEFFDDGVEVYRHVIHDTKWYDVSRGCFVAQRFGVQLSLVMSTGYLQATQM